MSRQSGYELSAAARLDLLETWNYLAENASTEVADKILADVESVIERIVDAPGLGHAHRDLTERNVLFYRVHSYLVIYRPEMRPLQVVRIVHAARDVQRILEK